jgi:mono/diheme cytochrome c family protein
MVRATGVIAALLLIGLFGFSQEKQEKKENPPAASEFKIPAEEAKRENPIKPTEASIAEGKRLHATQCAMCHGKEGDGKGDLAQEMELNMRDWRDPAALKDFTDGALFYVLHKGKDTMPGQEGRMRAEQEWNMINFIRSLAKKAPPPPPKPEKPD